MSSRFQQLLRDLQASLSRALAESSDVSRVLREIRREGWSLYLVVDQQQPSEGRVEIEAPRELSEGDPVFKIDGRDLSFLRSVGIDPTRKLKRRRGG